MKNLYKEVHILASRYHWSENEIMKLSRKKRKKYLNIIEEEEAGAE
ncbi:hypothetical protein DYY67_1365 [Candidatus Nitrosotalea sp. TS]|nr:hypothetical protein [Candidatus Nitrosotalea sp. TS]NHI03570.1 hypothetical protein [Candidatus Nitrosotalea sp. TS]